MPQTNLDTFIRNISLTNQKKEFDSEHLMGYDTIILDADDTMWDIKNEFNEDIPAKETVPPYKINEVNKESITDSNGNVIELKSGLIGTLNELRIKNKNIYVVSASHDESKDYENQQVVQILKTFNLYDIFDDVIISGSNPKSFYVNKIDNGRSVFIDDMDTNLIDVSVNTDSDAIDIKQHPNIFANWYNTVIKAESKDLDYPSIKRKIEEDYNLAKKGIYTRRDEDGNIIFRIKVSNGEILQIGRDFKKTNPHIYEGLKIPKILLEKIQEAHHQSFFDFEKRMNMVQQQIGTQTYDDQSLIDIIDSSDEIKTLISESGIMNGDNVDEDKLENFLNQLNPINKYIAGIIKMFQFFSNGGTINQIEAKNMAEQVANFEVFNSFNGEEEIRLKNDLDFIPNTITTQPINESAYVSEKISFLDSKNNQQSKIIEKLEDQAKKINKWISEGMYIYDDVKTKKYSENFLRQFEYYIESCELVKSLSQKIYRKMQKIAGELIP
jgi:predicted phosphatase